MGRAPMEHHGVVLKTAGMGYLQAHLTRDGLTWKVHDWLPKLPEETCYVRSYQANGRPLDLLRYCQQTQPFSYPDNDCEVWAHGALRTVGVREELYTSGLHPLRSSRDRSPPPRKLRSPRPSEGWGSLDILR